MGCGRSPPYAFVIPTANQDRTALASLLDVLRREGYFGVKHGCEDGSCGACTVLLSGQPRTSCTMLAAQAEGSEITTIEGVAGIALEGYGPSQGWRGNVDLHPIQQAFLQQAALQRVGGVGGSHVAAAVEPGCEPRAARD